MNASIVLFYLSLISNSLPTNEDICSSVITIWSVCYSACAKVLCFTIRNKHERSTEANVMSSTAFCGGQFCQLREKKMEKVERKRKTDRDLYDVEVIEVDTTPKQLKMHFLDSVTNTMSGVITIMKGITFPSFAWKKCFSPRKVRWRMEATFFTGDCIVASRESCGPAEKMTPRCA